MKSTIDWWQELIKSRGIGWAPINPRDLPDSTKEYYLEILQHLKKVQVADITQKNQAGKSILFRIDDPDLPEVGFLEHRPDLGIHQWVNRDFSNTMDPARVGHQVVLLIIRRTRKTPGATRVATCRQKNKKKNRKNKKK